MSDDNLNNMQNMLNNVSYLLGRVHGGLVMALKEEKDGQKIDKIIEIEAELRKEINRLYYPSAE